MGIEREFNQGIELCQVFLFALVRRVKLDVWAGFPILNNA